MSTSCGLPRQIPKSQTLKRNLAGQYEKLAFFEHELGITADVARKFELKKQIKEIRQLIDATNEEIAQIQPNTFKELEGEYLVFSETGELDRENQNLLIRVDGDILHVIGNTTTYGSWTSSIHMDSFTTGSGKFHYEDQKINLWGRHKISINERNEIHVQISDEWSNIPSVRVWKKHAQFREPLLTATTKGGANPKAISQETEWIQAPMVTRKNQDQNLSKLNSDSFSPTIGIVTALPKEYAAVQGVLGISKERSIAGEGSGRRYGIGVIPTLQGGAHQVVLALAGKGNNSAATRATLLLSHFSTLKTILMVGIAGGVPHPTKPDEHVRLGDIVVSNEYGVVQYDFVKEEVGVIKPKLLPRPPDSLLIEAVNYLQVNEYLGSCPWLDYIPMGTKKIKSANRPPDDQDVLHHSVNTTQIIPHPVDIKRTSSNPRFFTGPIASANILLKNPQRRDALRDQYGVKAIEMESSGIADATWNQRIGYLVIRGICDYCDEYKNDIWQEYAAVVAAAFTRALLESIPITTFTGTSYPQ